MFKPSPARNLDVSLMVVASLEGLQEATWKPRLAQLIEGGVSCVQLREKNLSSKEFARRLEELVLFLEKTSVGIIVNDAVALAAELPVAGLHIGENDEPILNARHLIGAKKQLGLTVSSELSLEGYGLENLQAAKVSYFGIGPVYPTPSKHDAPPALGLKRTKELVKSMPAPAIAIGGITLDSLSDVLATGVIGVAAVSALWGAKNPYQAAKSFRAQIDARGSFA